MRRGGRSWCGRVRPNASTLVRIRPRPSANSSMNSAIGGAARQRLQTERAGAGEEVEHARPVKAFREAMRQDVEQRLARAVGGRADRVGARRGQRPAAKLTADDPHRACPCAALTGGLRGGRRRSRAARPVTTGLSRNRTLHPASFSAHRPWRRPRHPSSFPAAVRRAPSTHSPCGAAWLGSFALFPRARRISRRTGRHVPCRAWWWTAAERVVTPSSRSRLRFLINPPSPIACTLVAGRDPLASRRLGRRFRARTGLLENGLAITAPRNWRRTPRSAARRAGRAACGPSLPAPAPSASSPSWNGP